MREKYFARDNVPCLSPAAVLAEGRPRPWSPGSVDVLMVDTEGMDDVVVRLWLALPGFLPTLIIYEHTHIETKRRKSIEERLEELYYECKPSLPNKWADTICIRQQRNTGSPI